MPYRFVKTISKYPCKGQYIEVIVVYDFIKVKVLGLYNEISTVISHEITATKIHYYFEMTEHST